MVRWVWDSAMSNDIGHGGVSAVAIVKKVLEVEENTKWPPIFFTKPEMKRQPIPRSFSLVTITVQDMADVSLQGLKARTINAAVTEDSVETSVSTHLPTAQLLYTIVTFARTVVFVWTNQATSSTNASVQMAGKDGTAKSAPTT